MRTLCLRSAPCTQLGTAAAALALASARAAEPPLPDSTGFIRHENDVFAGADRHYTSGLQLGTILSEDALGGRARALADALDRWFPHDRERATRRYGLVLGQSIYTPEGIESETLIENDRPYAGWLYATLLAQQENRGTGGWPLPARLLPDTLDSVEIDLGVLGPSSLAQQVQEGFHDAFGSQAKPRGWEHQLDDEFGFNLRAERRWRAAGDAPWGLSWDVVPRAGASVGLVNTSLVAGATARIGSGQARDFGPSPAGATQVAQFGRARRGWWWELHAGGEARLVLHDVFLEGNNFHSSHSVSPRRVVAAGRAGARIGWGDLSLGCEWTLTTESFHGQDGPDIYGALVLSAGF